MENPFEFHEEDTIIACVGDNGGRRSRANALRTIVNTIHSCL